MKIFLNTIVHPFKNINADYRGEIMVTLINHSDRSFSVSPGDRIAQGICALAIQLPGIKVKDVERGAGGFGSSGKN